MTVYTIDTDALISELLERVDSAHECYEDRLVELADAILARYGLDRGAK